MRFFPLILRGYSRGEQVLPGPQTKTFGQNEKFEYLEDYEVTEANTNEEGGKSTFFYYERGKGYIWEFLEVDEEEDEERGGGGQRVQCAQQ